MTIRNIRLLTLAVVASLASTQAVGWSGDQTSPGTAQDEVAKCLASGEAAKAQSAAMYACYTIQNERVNAELNREYRAKMRNLRPGRREVLRRSQRNWLKHRGPKCDKEAGVTKSMTIIPDDERFSLISCYISATEDRIAFVRSFR